MLTTDHATQLAGRRQRRAVREAAGFAAALGEPVGFLRRAVPGGAVFEAVALDSARTCAIVDEHGTLRLVPPARVREAPDHGDATPAPTSTPRFRAGTRRAAERALQIAARPGPRGA